MIKRVRICNFKSLADVSVDLAPVTILIGRSGTGKTNFVESLRFLRDYLATRNPAIALQPHGNWQRVLCATASKPVTLLFDVIFGVPGLSEDYRYVLTFQQSNHGGDPILAEERLSLGARLLYHRQGSKWVHPPAILNPPAPTNVVLGAITGVQEITIAYLMLTNGIGCYDFPSDVLQKSQNTPPGTEGLADNGGNAVHIFQMFVSNLTALSHWRNIVAILHSLNRSVRGVDIRLPEKNAVAVSHEIGDQFLVLDLTQESEGFRRFLAHLLALYQSPPKQTLIFEEPEKGIHPGALTALAEEFKICATKRGGQVLLTTHSPELLNQFGAESIRVAVMADAQTQIGPLVADQFESLREHLLDPGELLTVDPARLTTDAVPAG
jgi:type I restriction enzyme M protein